MAKNGKIQQVVMRVLAVMLVASFLLSVVSFVWPAPVSAEYYKVCYDWTCASWKCKPGHLVCRYWNWTIYQGGGHHCAELCGSDCQYDAWLCPQ